MGIKKDIKKAANKTKVTRIEKKPVNSKAHAKNVHEKFKKIASDRSLMPL
jgi:hypothetical protein